MIAIGDACEAYQLQIRPTPAECACAIALQGQLAEFFKGAPVRLPSESLHVTVFPFVDADEPVENKGAIWAAEKARWNAALDEILATTPPFALRFREARLIGRAVVALAESAMLDDLRDRIARRCVVRGRTFRRMNIVHLTLLRFGADQIPDPIDPMPIELDVVVEQLRLVRENVYPSLDVTVLRTFATQRSASDVP